MLRSITQCKPKACCPVLHMLHMQRCGSALAATDLPWTLRIDGDVAQVGVSLVSHSCCSCGANQPAHQMCLQQSKICAAVLPELTDRRAALGRHARLSQTAYLSLHGLACCGCLAQPPVQLRQPLCQLPHACLWQHSWGLLAPILERWR